MTNNKMTGTIEFEKITNNDLICKHCKFRIEGAPVATCKKYTVKPDKVMTGGRCNKYRREAKDE